jgi:hypothetical protein
MTIPNPTSATVSRLYKYSSLATPEHLERLRVIIQDREIYLPTLTQLNDPADGRPRLAALSEDQAVSLLFGAFRNANPGLAPDVQKEKETQIRLNVQRLGPDRLQQLITEQLNTEMNDFRVYSLSKRYDNMSMWAKYAADHSGYCLEFANDGPLFKFAYEVIYENSLKMDLTNPDHRKSFWLFRKKSEWSNEEEVRLALPRGSPPRVKIEPGWLTRLIFGKNVSDANRKTISEWAKVRMPELAIADAYYDAVDQQLKLR